MARFSIAVIGGTGAEGSGLCVRWAAAGYPIIIGSRSPEKAQRVAQELRELLPPHSAPITGDANGPAAEAGQVVVLSVPYSAQEATLHQIRPGCQGKVLVTVVVPLKPPKVAQVWRPPAGSAAEEAQAQLGPNVRVVAAFQNVSAAHLKELDHPVDCDILVAGDDPEAKAVAMELARAAGMFPVDAGPLANAGVPEGLTAVLIGINRQYRVRGSGIRITGIPRES